MQVTVIGRHIEATEALKQYATEKFSRLDKYLPKTVQVVVTISVVKKVHHIAEAVIKSNGLLIQASEETEEMYSAIDLLIEKIERQGAALQGKAGRPQTSDRAKPSRGIRCRARRGADTADHQDQAVRSEADASGRGGDADGASGQGFLHIFERRQRTDQV